MDQKWPRLSSEIDVNSILSLFNKYLNSVLEGDEAKDAVSQLIKRVHCPVALAHLKPKLYLETLFVIFYF